MYGVSDGGLAYFITKTVVEVPLVILQLLVQYLISYFMMDLQVLEFHFRLHTTTATTTSIYCMLGGCVCVSLSYSWFLSCFSVNLINYCYHYHHHYCSQTLFCYCGRETLFSWCWPPSDWVWLQTPWLCCWAASWRTVSQTYRHVLFFHCTAAT